MKTLVLEQSDIIGGCCSTFEVDGYKFDVGASIVEVIQPLERLFEMLGGKISDYLELIPCDPIYSFITDDGQRFSIPTDIDETTELVKRIAPEDVEGWHRSATRALHDRGDDGRGHALAHEHLQRGDATRMKNPQILKFAPTFARTHQGVIRSFYKTRDAPVGSVPVLLRRRPARARQRRVRLYRALGAPGIYYPRGA